LESVSDDLALSEAEQILQHILHCSRTDLYLRPNASLSKEKQEYLNAIVQRRILHEPLPYIFKKAYFHSLELYVDNAVLIPRPDTEIIVETVLKREKEDRCLFLDLGTGSGAISAVLTKERHRWRGIGSDISREALRVARRNCPGAVSLVNTDRVAAFKPLHFFDFIVSNPPYISGPEMEKLDASVKDFEPSLALYGGADGLDFYRFLAQHAPPYLKPQGRLYCEIGADQGGPLGGIFKSPPWRDVVILPDLAGRSRVCVCSLRA